MAPIPKPFALVCEDYTSRFSTLENALKNLERVSRNGACRNEHRVVEVVRCTECDEPGIPEQPWHPADGSLDRVPGDTLRILRAGKCLRCRQ